MRLQSTALGDAKENRNGTYEKVYMAGWPGLAGPGRYLGLTV